MYGDALHPILEDTEKHWDLTTLEGCKKYILYLSMRIVVDEMTPEQFGDTMMKLMDDPSFQEHQSD